MGQLITIAVPNWMALVILVLFVINLIFSASEMYYRRKLCVLFQKTKRGPSDGGS